MPDRYTTEEAAALLEVHPSRVNQLKSVLALSVEKVGGANFFSLPQIKTMKRWLAANGYKKGGKKR